MPREHTDNVTRAPLKQPRRIIAARRHHIGRVRGEGAIPDPPLVSRKRSLQIIIASWLGVVGDGKETAGTVGGTRAQGEAVWGKGDAGDVVVVCFKGVC